MACGLSPTPSPTAGYPFYRTIPPPVGTPDVHLSWLDRSPFTKLSPDAMTVSTDRGFRSARCNMSVREGTWYYEVYVERCDGSRGVGKGTAGGEASNAHIRVGWGRREAIVDAPVGFDGYSYGLRDTDCEKLHLSRRKPYGEKGRHITTGDIIGCLITLPPRSEEAKARTRDPDDRASIKRSRAPLRFKGQMYLESEEYKPSKEMEEMVDREGKLAKAAQEAAKLAATGDQAGEEKENMGGAKVSKGGKTKQATKSKGKSKAALDQDRGEHDRKPITLPGSSVSFFLNGQPIHADPAFENLFDFTPPPPTSSSLSSGKKGEPLKGMLHDDGTLGYYPMVSVFGRGKLRVNFGPEWLKPPSDHGGLVSLANIRPMCDRWNEFREEERVQDEEDEVELIERIQKEVREAEIKREAIMKRRLAPDAKKVKKQGTPSSRGGGGGGKAKGTSAGTPRSRLGTSVTPGPAAGLVSEEPTPASPTPGDASSIKMEVDSIKAESSRATSPVPKVEQNSEDVAMEDDDGTEYAVQFAQGDSDGDSDEEEAPLFE